MALTLTRQLAWAGSGSGSSSTVHSFSRYSLVEWSFDPKRAGRGHVHTRGEVSTHTCTRVWAHTYRDTVACICIMNLAMADRSNIHTDHANRPCTQRIPDIPAIHTYNASYKGSAQSLGIFIAMNKSFIFIDTRYKSVREYT